MDGDKAFNVAVSTVAGPECTISAVASENVLEFKQRVCEKLSIGKNAMRLVTGDRELVQGTLQSNNIHEDSRLVLVPDMKSGLTVTQSGTVAELQALVERFFSAISPDVMSAHLQENKPLKFDISLPGAAGTNAHIEIVVTPNGGSNAATTASEHEQRGDQQCSQHIVPELILWRRLSKLSVDCLMSHSVGLLRRLARVTATIADLPIESGLAAETVCAQHQMLDEVEKALSVNDTGEDNGQRGDQQQLLCDVFNILDRIKTAADKRQLAVAKPTSKSASRPRSAAGGKAKTANHSRPARAVAEENQAMHRKLLQLQKAMAERRWSKEGVRQGKRRPVVIHAPPPVTGFGGFRRGFLLAKA